MLKQELINKIIELSIILSNKLNESRIKYETYNLENMSIYNPIREEAKLLTKINIDIQELLYSVYNSNFTDEHYEILIKCVDEYLEMINKNKVR